MKKFNILVTIIFVLSLTTSTSLKKAAYAGTGFGQPAMHKESDLILLRAETIDTSKRPSLDKADIQAGLRLMGLNASDTAYYLVQFGGPIREEWKATVREAGGKLFGFVPHHAFIVAMNGAIAEEVAALPTVKWVGLYRPAYKIAPRLAAKAQVSSEPLVATIMTFEPSAVEEVVAAIEEWGGQALNWQAGSRWGLVRAEIEPATVTKIARLVEVHWIEPFVPPELTNDVARGAELMNVDVVHQDDGLTGAGQIIGHADSGLDVGDLATLHQDLRDRVKAAFAWGRRTIASFASPGSGPMGLAWDGTYLWNIDWATDELYKLTPSGEMLTSCEPAVAGRAADLTWDGSSFWYVERDDDTIYQLDTACNVLDSFAAPETDPMGLAWDGANLWISDMGEDTIYQVTTSGEVLGSFDSPGPYPSSLLWLDGYLWCGDSTDDVIYKLDASGEVLEWLPAPDLYASGLAWDGANMWVTDPALDEIFKLNLDPTSQGDWSDPNGHGTHTAASILGTGAAYVGNGSPGAGQYRGVAPGAQLVHQSVMDTQGRLTGIPLDLTTLFQQAYDEGARLHSDSWGANVAGEYTADSAAADAFMWDHKDMLLVFSAGNEGVDDDSDGVVDLDSMGSPATAKNVLTVGASENSRPSISDTWGEGWPSDYPANPVSDDLMADNSNGMAAFSSRGPTDDGRLKPDVVAPGTFIVSARSQEQPLKDDFESVTVSTSPKSPDVMSAQGHCEPKTVTDRDITSLTNWQANVTLVACAVESDASTGEVTTMPAATTADWTATGNWQLGTSKYHSPTHAWANAPYDQNAKDHLTSPVMDARGGPDIVGFWTWYDLEDGDRGIVWFSDDGSNWIGFGFTGSQTSWSYLWFPIPWGECWGWPFTTCLDNASRFRVRFTLDGDGDGDTGQGWYIDDVRIHSRGWGLLSEYDVVEYGSVQDEQYIFMGGTSMSTPLTAGAAALVRQFYTDREGISPSAALVKATLINGATDMTPGQYGVGSTQEITARPDHVQGWGRVNLGHTLFPADPRKMYYWDTSGGLWTGESEYMHFNVTDASEPLRITLVWTDYPSTVAAASNLVNNLDLKLTGPGPTIYYPNGLDTADALNNVEGIDVANPPPGAYAVEVHGTEIVEGPQPYALVITGAVGKGSALVVTKNDDPDPVQPGELLAYAIAVSNSSALDATGVIITDTIPADTTFAWASDGGSYDPGPPQAVIWSDLEVAAGASITVSCQVTVDSPLAHGTVLTNTVEAVPAQGVGGMDTITTTVFLPPVASFTSDSPVCLGQTMHFADTSQYATTYLWNFGDGTTSTDRNPTHDYSNGGDFTVTLTATNAIGSDTYSDIVTVKLAPEAAFSYEPTIVLVDTVVHFTDESTNDPTSWLWDFGDSNTSILQNPTHVYEMKGAFTVALTATNACGLGVTSETIEVIEFYDIYLPLVLKNR
jgi:uncharacterized repeat protein (TIGR01451 family)